MATLLAFSVLGFFAAAVLTLIRFMLLVLAASFAVSVLDIAQGMPVLHGVGLGFAILALAQVGFGIGLVWVASSR